MGKLECRYPGGTADHEPGQRRASAGYLRFSRLTVVTLAVALMVSMVGIAPAQAHRTSTFTASARPSRTVVQSAPATIGGRLTPGGYRVYRFQKLVSGTWRTIHTGRTNSSGYTRLSISTARTGVSTYRYCGLRTTRYAADCSNRVTITVKPGITAWRSLATVLKGRTATISGKDFPVQSGRSIYLHRYYSRTWHTVGHTHTNAYGNYRFMLPTTTTGFYTYRVHMPRVSAYRPASTTGTRKVTVWSRPYLTNITCQHSGDTWRASFTLVRPPEASVRITNFIGWGQAYIGEFIYNGHSYDVNTAMGGPCGY